MINVIIFGAPGSGKGTQAEFIKTKFKLKHISTGDILREEIKKNSEIGKVAASIINKGNLLPDNIIIDMLEKIIIESNEKNGFIFDGFPRTVNQGIALQKVLSKLNKDISIVINLEVEENILIDRIIKRAEKSGRLDDNKEVIVSRLNVYHKETEPLKNIYEQQGKLVTIEGNKRIEEINKDIEIAINNISNN